MPNGLLEDQVQYVSIHVTRNQIFIKVQVLEVKASYQYLFPRFTHQCNYFDSSFQFWVAAISVVANGSDVNYKFFYKYFSKYNLVNSHRVFL